MTKPGSFTLPLIVGLFLPVTLLIPEVAAGKDTGVKEVRASAHLKKALKNLQKTQGYHINLLVQGGVSNSPDHKVDRLSVWQNYVASVVGKKQRLMYVPDMKTYRTFKTGVRFSRGTWRNLVADGPGKIMDRLFAFPEIALSRAVKHGKKARWVEKVDDDGEEGEEEVVPLDPRETPGDDAGKPENKKRSKTVPVVRKNNRDAAGVTPRHMRVEVPTKVALEHFLEVEKSGCFGGG